MRGDADCMGVSQLGGAKRHTGSMRVTVEERSRYLEIVKRWEESKLRDVDLVRRPPEPPPMSVPQVVEYRLAPQNEAQCTVLLSDGKRCPSPALEGYEECIRHARWNTLLPASPGLPYPEDAISLQEFMARAVSMLLLKRMTAEEAQAVASLCALMLKNLPRCEAELRRGF